MHFCLTGQYTPQALNHMMDHPTTSRLEAAKKLVEAAGGKLVSMYSTPADGPGVMVIFDVPEPGAAPAICGVVVASGALHHVKLTRLLSFGKPTSRRASKNRRWQPGRLPPAIRLLPRPRHPGRHQIASPRASAAALRIAEILAL
jgi:uncharacterized protein with GYD domain